MTGLFLSLFLISSPITAIEFTGNESVAARTLRREIVSRVGGEYRDLDVTYDVERIGWFYRGRGFFATEVTPEVAILRDTVSILYRIEEGFRPRIKEIVLSGETVSSIRDYLRVRPGGYFMQSRLTESARALEDHFKDRGYPFAEVEYSVQPDSGILVFEIRKGGLYYVRNIEVRGLTRTRPDLVRREVELARGDVYNKSRVYNSQRRIYALGFLGMLQVEMARVEPDSLDLIFNARELKSRILNFGAGVTLPFSFLLSVGLEELNLANLGHRVNITPQFKVNIAREWEVKVEGRYTLPHVTSLHLSISALPFVWFEDNVDFFRYTRGNEFRVTKVFTEHAALNLSHHYKDLRLEPRVTLPDTIRGVTNSVKLQFLLDLRDEFFNPKKGIYMVPAVEYAGGIFGGENHYLRLENEERLFLEFLGQVIAQRFKAGVLIPTNGVSVYELYYLGGQYTLRGYPERSLGPDSFVDERYGRILLNLNLEYRVGLPFNFGVVGFFDAGYINNELDLADRQYLKTTAGIGLRYFTPIGPIRLDWGFPLQDAGSELYLGIYHTF